MVDERRHIYQRPVQKCRRSKAEDNDNQPGMRGQMYWEGYEWGGARTTRDGNLGKVVVNGAGVCQTEFGESGRELGDVLPSAARFDAIRSTMKAVHKGDRLTIVEESIPAH